MKEKVSDIQHRLPLVCARLGITQKELAKRAKMRESSISYIVQGKSNPLHNTICKIADAVGVSPEWLMGYGADNDTVMKQSTFSQELIKAYNSADQDIRKMVCDLLGIEMEKDSVPTPEHIKLMIENANPKLKIAIILSSSYGIRLNEICALTYGDIDYNSKAITIDKALTRTADGWKPEHYIAAPSLFCYISEELLEAIGLGKKEDSILDISPFTLRGEFSKLMSKLSLPYKWYDLRRYALVHNPSLNPGG